MNAWPFIIAAYATTAAAMTVLLVGAWRAMRSAERQAEALRQEQP